MSNLSQADGAGQIDIGGKISPVSYHVIARDSEGAAAKQVHIEISLPRDWLVAQGFKSQAVLIRENGTRTEMRADSQVDVADPISIVLASDPKDVASENELGSAFPELKVH